MAFIRLRYLAQTKFNVMKTIAFILMIIPSIAWNSRHAEPKHVLAFGGISCLTTAADAEKILGAPVKLTANTYETKNGIFQNKCTYTAVFKGGRPGVSNLYCMYERYPDAGAAHKVYSSIVNSNKNVPGQEQLKGVGDEGYFHSDKQNFSLVILRKNNEMFRFKINKLINKTSADELKKFAVKLSNTI